MCETCTTDVPLLKEDIELFSDSEYHTECPYTLPIDQSKQLHTKLLELRSDIISTDPATVLVGASVLSGLTNKTIKQIIQNCFTIKTVEDLQNFGITSPEYATLVFEVITTFTNRVLN